jgi:hypothetical protein
MSWATLLGITRNNTEQWSPASTGLRNPNQISRNAERVILNFRTKRGGRPLIASIFLYEKSSFSHPNIKILHILSIYRLK